MMGLAMNWRKEKREPRSPPNKTLLKWAGAPTRPLNRSTWEGERDLILGRGSHDDVAYLGLQEIEQTTAVIFSVVGDQGGEERQY